MDRLDGDALGYVLMGITMLVLTITVIAIVSSGGRGRW